MTLEKLTEEAYEVFAETHPCANFLNSIYAGRRFQKRGWEVVYLGLRENQEIRAATLLVATPVRLGMYYYAPRGFLLDYEDASIVRQFVKELKVYLRSKKCLYLKIDPYVAYQEHDIDGNIVADGFRRTYVLKNLQELGFKHQGFQVGYNEETQIRWMSILNLRDKSEQDIMDAMIPARRRMLKNGLRKGIQVRELSMSELFILNEVLSATCERQGFHDIGPQYYEEAMEIYGEHAGACAAFLHIEEFKEEIQIALQQQQDLFKDTCRHLEVYPNSKKMKHRKEQCIQKLHDLQEELHDLDVLREKKGNEIVLSAAFYYVYGNELVYLAGGSYEEYMKFRGSYAIQWYMIKKALSIGCDIYNFYGISGNFQKNEEGYGVFDFKRGFHAEVIELVGDFILPMNPIYYTLYQGLQKLKQRLHTKDR